MSATEQAITVRAGGTVTFTWTGQHNVAETTKLKYGTCDMTGAIILSDAHDHAHDEEHRRLNGHDKATSYTYTAPNTAGVKYMVCEVSGHCYANQKAVVTVETCNENMDKDTKAEPTASVASAIPVTKASLLMATVPPTQAPTVPPTKAGQVLVKKLVSVPSIKTSLTLPMSAAEANTPVMKRSVATGTAKAVGVPVSAVTVVVDSDERHLIVGTAGKVTTKMVLEIAQMPNIDSTDSEATKSVAQLQAAVETAFTGGQLVRQIQQAALENGALTEQLQSMSIAQDKPVMEPSTVTVTVVTVEDKVWTAEDVWTVEDKVKPSAKDSADKLVPVWAVLGVLGALLTGTAFWCYQKKGQKKPPTHSPDKSAAYEGKLVAHGEVEDQLSKVESATQRI